MIKDSMRLACFCMLFSIFVPLAGAQASEGAQGIFGYAPPIIDIDWKDRALEKVVLQKNGARRVRLDNEKTYFLTKNLLIEEVNEGKILIQKNIYDFDNDIIIHEFPEEPDGTKVCQSLVTPFSSISSRVLEEKVSLSCFMLGGWAALVQATDIKNPFYQRYCEGRYDNRLRK